MIPPSRGARSAFAVAAALALTLGAGCARRETPPATTVAWFAGRVRPAFDPDGPPDALRVALERHLSRGLVERAHDGSIVPGLADSIGCSADSLTWTFRLPEDLLYTDGSPVASDDLHRALVSGLGRADHATRSWLLGAVRGVSQVRAGRPLPALGIETPDARTLVVRLAIPDRRLLEKLAVPGVSTPWKERRGDWEGAVGVGPYRVASADARGLTLAAAAPGGGVAAGAATLRVRFESGAPRARAMLRRDLADVLWPLPPRFLERPLPADWSVSRVSAEPARRLLLVLRADVPPLTRPGARQSLAHALNREELLAALGTRGAPLRRWLPGATQDYDWPRLETPVERFERRAAETRDRAVRGAGRAPVPRGDRVESYHLVLACDADLSGAEVAEALQGQWERAGHYVDLRALRGAAAGNEALRVPAAQAQLVEAQAPLDGLEAELATMVMPLRGPAVGSFRTGWRTREFDRWLLATGMVPGPDPDAVQAVLASERIVLPVASLPWQFAVRNGVTPPDVHPAHGPAWTRPARR